MIVSSTSLESRRYDYPANPAGHGQLHHAQGHNRIASLIETCKLHGVDPQSYLADVLTRLVNLWPASRLDELMPWAWAEHRADSLAA
jgi:hypothetical protein